MHRSGVAYTHLRVRRILRVNLREVLNHFTRSSCECLQDRRVSSRLYEPDLGTEAHIRTTYKRGRHGEPQKVANSLILHFPDEVAKDEALGERERGHVLGGDEA